jgi:hypothetical protein
VEIDVTTFAFGALAGMASCMGVFILVSTSVLVLIYKTTTMGEDADSENS